MERIRHKLGRIAEHVSMIRSIKDECMEKFSKDPIYRGALLHYLYLMADSCITVAELTIKQKGLRPAQYYAEAFDILGENNILDRSFSFGFARIASFRNFLAHDYESVDAAIICGEILEKLDDVEVFLEQIRKALGLNGATS